MSQFVIHNHHKTSSLRPRDSHDRYPTPEPLVRGALTRYLLPLYPAEAAPVILDPGAGEGVWGQVARELWPKAYIVGTEIDDSLPQHPSYNEWWNGNHLSLTLGNSFDLTIGNPPYGDLWDIEQRRLKREALKRGESYQRPPRPESAGPYADAEAFVHDAHRRAVPGGQILFLLRTAFLEGQDRRESLWKIGCPHLVANLPKRPSFTANGKTDATAYSLFWWKVGEDYANYLGDWLDW